MPGVVPHRPARRRPDLPPAEEVPIEPVPPPPPAATGWLTAVLPATGVLPVLALGMTGRAHGTGLLLALLTIPAVAGTAGVYVVGRRHARRDAARRRERWSTHLRAQVAVAAGAADRQRLALDRVHPTDLVAALAAGWAFERRPDHDDAMVVAVGAGPVPARRPLVRRGSGPLDDVDPALVRAADAAVTASRALTAAPVTVDLRAARVLAVVGDRAEVGAVLARAVGELAALHAPGELAVVGAGLGWATDLPHARAGPGTTASGLDVARWLAAPDGAPLRVAVIAAYAPGRCPELDAALGEGGVALVGVARAADIPAAAGAVLTVAARTLWTAAGTCPLDTVDRLPAPDAAAAVAAIAALVPAAAVAAPSLRDLLALPRDRLLQVPVGLDPAGAPVDLCLTESAAGGDGPHGLLVGATGSGKSVLLRTIVAGLAARHSPTELTLLLVDFKGGAAFADLAGLPHVGGLVTNLADEPGLLRRMARALDAELDRRQRVLRDGGGPPALVVVLDEAGELLAADPDLAGTLGRIGRIGRSLGVHLLLATQHWEGGRVQALDVHLRYRLCLRTFTAQDSRAVLGSDAALRLPPRPGAGWLSVDGVQRRVDVLAPPADPASLVPAWRDRADPVWLPPLPALLHWPADGSIGRLDRPDLRAQPQLRIDLSGPGGHVAVAGGPRSGVTTTLRAIVHAACNDAGPRHLHVHVLDLSGGLADLGALPQVGTVAGLHQPQLVRAVVECVRDELARRSTGGTGPRVLLVVDGAGLLRSADGLVEEAMRDLAARGLGYDIHLVLGVRRWSDLRGGLFDAATTRIELRLGDPAESLAGRIVAGEVPADVPGRGLLPDGTVLQVARTDAATLPSWPGRAPRVRLLPEHVVEPPPGAGFLLGAGGPRGEPVGLDLTAPGRHLVVSGDAGSGRSTVLRRLVRQLAGREGLAVHVVDPRRTVRPPAGLAASWSYAPERAAAVLVELTANLRARMSDEAGQGWACVVVIDDLDLLVSAHSAESALGALAELLPYAAEIGLHVVVARPAGGRVFDPLTPRLRSCAPWQLWLPGDHLDGPAAGRAAPTVVGRGLLADGRGPARVVQCYLEAPEEPDGGRGSH